MEEGKMAIQKKNTFSDVPPILRNYLNFMTVIKGKSPATVREYYYDLRMFLRYIHSRRQFKIPDELEAIN